MKKLICLFLIVLLTPVIGAARADMSLFDVWQELTWDVPEYTSRMPCAQRLCPLPLRRYDGLHS